MCLIIKPVPFEASAEDMIKEHTQIAKEDIKVYKILTWANYSPYRNFLYTQGKLYETKLVGEILNFRLEISEGFHAYTSRNEVKTMIYTVFNCYVTEMIIPKGAKYILNAEETNIVSNKIYWPF
jgi:hypothetical protein